MMHLLNYTSGAILISFILGLLFRFNIALMRSCLLVGREICEEKSGNGFQDAITPPWSTNMFIFIVTVFFTNILFVAYTEGIIVAIYGVFSFLTSAILGGLLIVPNPESRFWVEIIVRSLASRFADYKKNHDDIRAEAVEMLLERIREKYF